MTGADRFELLLFSTDRGYVQEAVEAGVDGIVVDWERAGKHARQAGADTEINADTLADLERVRSWVDARVVCRVNPYGERTQGELEAAIGAGADEVLIPMVRQRWEVERVLDGVRGRCGVGILIETVEAVERASELAALPLCRVYVGLNDLAIERGTPNIFSALADGTVERVRGAVHGRFGFGGLTVPERGAPVPCAQLIGEMARLGCSFSFLRRSYRRDVPRGAQAAAIERLREALAAAASRSRPEIERDRERLVAAIAAWPRPAALAAQASLPAP